MGTVPVATSLLLSALLIAGEFGDNTSLIRVLGQCLLRTPDKQLPGLGNLLASNLIGPAQRLATTLIALVVKADPEAYRLAILGDAEGIRRTEVGKSLFRIERKQLPSQLSPIRSVSDKKIGFRQGRVSAFYPERNFGFIVEDTTGQTWFFHSSSVDDDSLLGRLVNSEVRQYVRFSGNPEAVSGKYPLANTVQLISSDGSILGDKQERAPLKVRLAGIPKDGSFYARAKKAEQLDQLDRAEAFYREEIAKNRSHIKSAIKDLAALLNRKGHTESAIEILKEHRSKYSALELISLDQMTVQFLVKARRFVDASHLLAQLAKQEKEKRSPKQLEWLRQEAYCYFAAGDLDTALGKLSTLLTSYPRDNATLLLIEKVKQTKESGSTREEAARMADDVAEGDESLASLALGLSALARRHLDNCELRGLDARVREKNEFAERDFRQVEELLERLKGRRPRERADYLLTLAALCERAPDAAGRRSLHQYLRRHFSAVAEAILSEHGPPDVVRCYLLESLVLCPYSPSSQDIMQVEAALVLLLGSYSSEELGPSTLLEPEPGERIDRLAKRFIQRSDDWTRFLSDASYYRLRAPAAFAQLDGYLSNTLLPMPQDLFSEKSRIKEEEATFHALFSGSLSADRLRMAREMLAQCVQNARFELDRQRLLDAVKVFGDSADYALERHFRERETRYLRLGTDIKRYLDDITRQPTHLSIEKLYPVFSSLLSALRDDFDRADTARPALDVRNVLDNDFYMANENVVALRLLLTSRDESAPPIEAIDLLVDGGNGDPCHSPEPLHGGQSRELELVVRPSEEQIADGAFTVNITVGSQSRP